MATSWPEVPASPPWGPGARSFALLRYQPIRGTAAGLPAELPRLVQGTAHTAMWHRWHSTALLGAEPVLKASRGFAPPLHEANQETPSCSGVPPPFQIHEVQSAVGTHQDVSALPTARPWIQPCPKECSGAGRAQDGQAG